eukprot:3941997-Prymnesium_polylepis.1
MLASNTSNQEDLPDCLEASARASGGRASRIAPSHAAYNKLANARPRKAVVAELLAWFPLA